MPQRRLKALWIAPYKLRRFYEPSELRHELVFSVCVLLSFGAEGGSRTRDPRFTIPLLCQLSYLGARILYSPLTVTYRRFGLLLVVGGILLVATAISTHPFFRLIVALPDVLGFRGSKTYLVLLQNNTELRPTGGFMGAFALVTMDRGK